MSIVQTVYAVGMTLGLKSVLEASYTVFFLPIHKGADTLPRGIIAVAFFVVMLLGIRFFWVPRNVYAYIIRPHTETADDFFRKVTIFQIPIALAHAVVFFFVCHAFSEMAYPEHLPASTTGAQLAVRFVAMYGALLLLNAKWLFWITPRQTAAHDFEPGRIWARSNMTAAVVIGLILGAFGIWHISDGALIFAAGIVFSTNSVFDLVKCAKYYILFEPPAAAMGEMTLP